jgi:hypothetical protein
MKGTAAMERILHKRYQAPDGTTRLRMDVIVSEDEIPDHDGTVEIMGWAQTYFCRELAKLTIERTQKRRNL